MEPQQKGQTPCNTNTPLARHNGISISQLGIMLKTLRALYVAVDSWYLPIKESHNVRRMLDVNLSRKSTYNLKNIAPSLAPNI